MTDSVAQRLLQSRKETFLKSCGYDVSKGFSNDDIEQHRVKYPLLYAKHFTNGQPLEAK